MLKELRIKFIALNMVLATLILVVAFSTICFLDYRTRVDAVEDALDEALQYAVASLYDSHSSQNITGMVPLTLNLSMLDLEEIDRSESVMGNSATAQDGEEATEGDGSSSASEANGAGEASDGTVDDEAAQAAGSDDDAGPADGQGDAASDGSGSSDEGGEAADDGTPPLEIGGHDRQGSQVIPLAVYVLDSDGHLSMLTQLTTASISEGVRELALEEARRSAANNGYLRGTGLYFAKRTAFKSECIAFADGSSVSGWQGLAWSLVGIGVCTLGAFLAISIFFSRWAFKPIEAAWKAQQQFTADASHELKTPLTVILANMQILASHPEDTIASQSQWIESTQTEGESMRVMINDMLDLARPEAMRMPKVLSDVDLTDLLEGDALQFESVAFERGIDLTMDIEQGIHLTGDEMRLHRLTSTLIDNACKYAEEGGAVDVTLTQTSRDIHLVVHNTGSFIAPEDLPHVFDRFYRADKARSRESGSYGLGLSIARNVAQEHGGDIEVSSSQSAGTTFTVTLPKRTS